MVGHSVVGFEQRQYLISRFENFPARSQNLALRQHDPHLGICIPHGPDVDQFLGIFLSKAVVAGDQSSVS